MWISIYSDFLFFLFFSYFSSILNFYLDFACRYDVDFRVLKCGLLSEF